MAKRRFQKGRFEIVNGKAYSLYYEDDRQADGSLATRRVRHLIGKVPEELSERAAQREHDRLMQVVNQRRGSVAPAIRGRKFSDLVGGWRRDIFPHLSPATVRQRESYLRTHIIPRLGDSAVHTLDLALLQTFATQELRKALSRKSTELVMSIVLGVLDYARKRGLDVPNVSFGDIQLGKKNTSKEAPCFTDQQAAAIIQEASEPYKTMFLLAWLTGLRAGELLALTTDDLNFDAKTIRVNKTADDNTRIVREAKTDKSVAKLPMPSALERTLRDYLAKHWNANAPGLLFPNPKGTRPRSRDNVVKYRLKPILKKLGIPSEDVGFHAFRHGLATKLADSSVPLPVLQSQMRHADVRTTLRIYSHVIQDSQRDAMENIARSIGTKVPFGTEVRT